MVSHGKSSNHDFPVVFTVAVDPSRWDVDNFRVRARPSCGPAMSGADTRSGLRAILPHWKI
jgi:hypothetical protein